VEDDEQKMEALRQDLLGIDPKQASDPFDAVRLLHFARFTVGERAHNQKLWDWAEQAAAPHPEDATILSMLAVLGDIIRSQEPSAEQQEDVVEVQQIDQLFRQSLRLDPENVGNFARAGAFYLDMEDLGEAERCLSRGFRLARDSGFVALRLAEVYRRTDRPRDALAVLDMALREGCDDPGVAWDAAMTALNLDQFDSLLTYADRFEAMQPGEAWTQYYRATALLEMGELEGSLAALEEEQRRSPEQLAHVNILRACVAAATGDADGFRTLLRSILETPLRTIDYLTLTGLSRLYEKLWRASRLLPDADDLRLRLDDRLLTAGLAPDDFFDKRREENELDEGVNFYRCTAAQPLDEHWAGFAGCLAGQEGWQRYHAEWGVLARDEDEAQKFLLQWQSRCYRLSPEVESVDLEQEGFRDRVGVVWQGFRWGETEEAE
jgi:tetratricopeptide (TPR) repeat protein